jgi:aspartyl-tRNA(Asn)/glutamyl-tRNA(Gln) amidotransferase subunit A
VIQFPRRLTELQTLIQSGQIDPLDCLQDQANLMYQVNHQYPVIVETLPINESLTGPLRGIGLLHKDLFNLSGRDPGFGHALGQNNPELEDAYVITQLKQAGCGILGTVVMAPYACGATSQNPYFSRSSNPLNENYAVGGSSSGSAIAVASKMSYVSLGSDTAGSIRIPAATCGITGLKTTQGLISLQGVATLSESLDTVGLLGRYAKDIELILDVVVSHSLEPLEAISHFNYWLPKEAMDPSITSHIKSFLSRFEDANAVDIKEYSQVKQAADIVMAYEINRNYAEIIQSPDGPKGLKSVGKLASQITQKDYENCIESKEQLTSHFINRYLNDGAFLILPCLPISIPLWQEVEIGHPQFSKESYLSLFYMMGWVNFLGLPAISFPIGNDDLGRPISIQVIGRPFAEKTLLNFAHEMEHQLFGGSCYIDSKLFS